MLKIPALSLCIRFVLRTPEPGEQAEEVVTTELSTATLCFFFPSTEAQRHLKCRASLGSPHSADLVT